MKTSDTRYQREMRTIETMAKIYCDAIHPRPDRELCADCQGLLAYAGARLTKCPFGTTKPVCSECPIHCYHPNERELTRNIMRLAGPQMIWKKPWLALMHLWDKFRSPSRIRAWRQAREHKQE